MTVLSDLTGDTGSPVRCQRLGPELAAHFWAEPLAPGDLCLCGSLPYRAPTGDRTNERTNEDTCS